MGRHYEYFCDHCQRKFGTETHLNVKQMRIDAATFEGAWCTTKIANINEEKHFCNLKCLGDWLEACKVAVGRQLSGGEQ